MVRLLELDYEGRKAFAFQQLQDVPEWSDVHSINEFDMEQNKGIELFNQYDYRWLNTRYLQAVKEIKS